MESVRPMLRDLWPRMEIAEVSWAADNWRPKLEIVPEDSAFRESVQSFLNRCWW